MPQYGNFGPGPLVGTLKPSSVITSKFANDFEGFTATPYAGCPLCIMRTKDSPNTSPNGDFEVDGYANLGAKNDFGKATVNITQIGNFAKAPYRYKLTPLKQIEKVVKSGAGLGKI
jgi:pectate lyase